jgi:hypothetical protein
MSITIGLNPAAACVVRHSPFQLTLDAVAPTLTQSLHFGAAFRLTPLGTDGKKNSLHE